MPILQQRDREVVRRKLDVQLRRDVNLTLYTQGNTGLYIPGRDCRSCDGARELAGELSDLSARVRLKVVDFYSESAEASRRGIERIPAFTVGAAKRDNVRFYGLPSGFEFAPLLDAIIAASGQQSSLQRATRKRLRSLKQDIHVQVFVTPGCQYSPSMAGMAYAMAMESPRVRADVVEIQEFPGVRSAYNVMGVPKTVINDRVQFTGAVPEEVLLRRFLQAVGEDPTPDKDIEDYSDQTTPIG